MCVGNYLQNPKNVKTIYITSITYKSLICWYIYFVIISMHYNLES